MSQSGTESRPTGSAGELEVVERGEGWFRVKHRQTGNVCTIEDTFAEMFPMWVGRVLITAASEEWALTSARAATGFAVSIIMSPAEAGVEKTLPPEKTPDGRPGAVIQVYHTFGYGVKDQLIRRVGQCILTCPTTAAFNALDGAKKRLKIGASLRYFGDGFEKADKIGDRKVWRIPVMEGEFVIEDRFGVKRGVAGGNFLILAKDQKAGLESAVRAAEAIRGVEGAVLTFPGGVCRSGSKVGSIKYKLPASTNNPFCPTLKSLPGTQLSPDVNSVYELVINGLDLSSVKQAISEGAKAAVRVPGVIRLTAANYGGKLGPYRAHLKEAFGVS